MSRSIGGGPPISVLMGGLNYQIEHHLFPSMARPQLRKAQPSSLKHAGRDLDPPAAEHSAEARGRFILDHDPAAAARSDGPQLTATNQPPHELSG